MTFAQTLTPYQRELLLNELLELMTPEERAKILTPGIAPKLPEDITLDSLRDRKEITQRTANSLYRAGMRSLHDIYSMSPRALMNIRFIGKSAYSEIVEILREHEYDVSTFELWNGKKVDNT
jgi:DNA-directed RNA polymerase alpha subunit